MNTTQTQAASRSTFIDLFAGIGANHVALELEGSRCVFASELDPLARGTYAINFGMFPSGNILKIDVKNIPDHDILTAGFPCQSYSKAGTGGGRKDPRGKLVNEVFRILESKQPKIAILENVPNLLSPNKNDDLEFILSEIKSCGYTVFHSVLNAANFGLPQSRNRLFFTAFRKDLGVQEYEFPVGTEPSIPVAQILETRPDVRRKVFTPKGIRWRDEAAEVEAKGVGKRPILIGEFSDASQGDRIYSIKGTATTLTAFGGGSGTTTGLYLLDGKVVGLTPRECARLQGFPDSFRILGSHSRACSQFGNSAPIPVIRAIYRSVVDVIECNKNPK